MYQQQVRSLINLLMLVDALVVACSVNAASYALWMFFQYDWRLDDLDSSYITLFLIFANNFVMGKLGLYSDRRPASFLSSMRDILLATAIVVAMLAGALFSLKIALSRLFILICASIMVVLFTIARAMLTSYLLTQTSAGYNCHRILLAGAPDRVQAVNEALNQQRSWGHKVIGYLLESGRDPIAQTSLPLLGGVADLQETLTRESVDEVIFTLSPDNASGELRKWIGFCEELGITYRIVPALYDPKASFNLDVESVQGIPTLVKNTVRINYTGMFYKRVLDYVVGSVGFLIFLLLYPILGLLIKLDSPGPILFRQPRVGEHGRVFHIYKFRTMRQDAEQLLPQLMAQNEMKGHMFKMTSDPRVTKLGAFLRKTSLDEFPQFLNVIRGEMSLVGTRPPTVQEVSRYEARHRRRISIKPGITGLWQISGRNKIENFEQVLQLDLQYIDHWRFMDDLAILWKTIWVVLARKGAR